MSREKKAILPKLFTHGNDLSKKWFVYYSYLNPQSGKMKRFRIYEGLSEFDSVNSRTKAGEKIVRKLSEKLRQGWNPFEDNSSVIYQDQLVYTFGAKGVNKAKKGVREMSYYISRYMDSLIGIRPSTRTSYKSKFRYFMEFINMRSQDEQALYVFNEQMADDFNLFLKNTRLLTNKTINEYNVLLKTFYGYLVKSKVVSRNVFAHIKKLKCESNKPRIYDSELITRIVSYFKDNDPQMYLAIRIIFSCFIRPGELRQLKMMDIDFTYGHIVVPAQVAKTKKQRKVIIPDYLLQVIRIQFQGKYPPGYFIITAKGEPGEKQTSRNYLYNRFVKARKALDIGKEYILYAFKHTGMVELKRSGADWLAVKEQAGHKSLDQTIAYTTDLMGDANKYIKEQAPQI